jgi:hypothetical protein
MPIHNTYGTQKVEMKVGNLSFEHYDIGDAVYVPDGVYMAPQGIVVIKDGVFIAEYGLGQILDFNGNSVYFKISAA